MPISTMMLETVESTGTRCDIGASRPMVATTLVPASQHRDTGGDQGAEGDSISYQV